MFRFLSAFLPTSLLLCTSCATLAEMTLPSTAVCEPEIFLAFQEGNSVYICPFVNGEVIREKCTVHPLEAASILTHEDPIAVHSL